MSEKPTLKVVSWTPEDTKLILKARLDKAVAWRKEKKEARWKENENRLFGMGTHEKVNMISYNSLEEVYQASGSGEVTESISIPKVAQNLRFLHSQMSANPVSAMASPTSNELSDRRSTEAAQDLINYGEDEYDFQEYVDLTSLSTLTYGSGIIKSYHDPYAGKLLTHNTKTDEIVMTGDYKLRPRLIWNLWFDTDAEVQADIGWAFERITMTFGQAINIWPTKRESLMQSMVDKHEHPQEISGFVPNDTDNPDDMIVEVYEYTERGLPENGMAGRNCYILRDGEPLDKMRSNPHPNAVLPYYILTDIDDPNSFYGLTTVDYAIGLAKIIDSLDNMILDNVELHGSIKLVVFGNADTNEEDLSDDPVDIIHVNVTPAHAPYQLKPASVSSDIYSLRAQMVEAIDGIMGVNELLQGQINRELSGFASQTAINAANMVRHRLFNKYKKLVQFVYTNYLENVKKYWKVSRRLEVAGKEDVITVKYLSAADISGGYSLKISYGESFSKDPERRREEILQGKDLFVEAGISPKAILRYMKYNEVDNLVDIPEIARNRQLEIFERAIEHYDRTGNIVIEPASKMRKAYHTEMAEAGLEYTMTRDFLDLDRQLQEAIYEHIDQREQMEAQTATAPAQGAPSGAPPEAGAPPAIGEPAPEAPQEPAPDIGDVLP